MWKNTAGSCDCIPEFGSIKNGDVPGSMLGCNGPDSLGGLKTGDQFLTASLTVGHALTDRTLNSATAQSRPVRQDIEYFGVVGKAC